MAIKNVFLFALLAGLIVIGGCKKTCSFPERQEGNSCWEIRNDLIGNYYGKRAMYAPGQPGAAQYQLLMQEVGSYTETKDSINIGGLKGVFDDSLRVGFPDQAVMLNGGKPYHVNGTGVFTDTVLYGKPNKMLSLDLLYTADTDTAIVSGFPVFKLIFSGLR